MFRHVILVSAFVLLGACGDPLGGLDRIAQVDLVPEDAQAAALPTEAEVAREGFFGTASAQGDVALPQTSDAPEVATVEAEAAPIPRRLRLLGLLRRNKPDQADDLPEDTQADAIAAAVAVSEAQSITAGTTDKAEADVELAAVIPEIKDPAPTTETPAKRGLFGLGARKRAPAGLPEDEDVGYGVQLPYGVVVRSCASRGRPLGRKVEKADARGFALHDSDPRSEGTRTWYVTGFDDGCPRQLTAANALLGSASLYETLHYGPGGENLPKGETDKAYARLKRKICGTGKGKPCGAKMAQMDKRTFFVTAYERFGNSSRWTQVLVHDGVVIAVEVKPDS